MPKLTESDMKEFQKCFKNSDRNADDLLSLREMKAIFGQNMDISFFKSLDINKDNGISFNELLAFLR